VDFAGAITSVKVHVFDEDHMRTDDSLGFIEFGAEQIKHGVLNGKKIIKRMFEFLFD
jgi:hypothetical protein